MNDQSIKALPKTDIILWGATSFVGQLVAAYLWPRYGATGEVSFALGGRSKSKLKSLHRDLKADDRLPLVVGNAADAGFLDALTKKAKVVLSTVGPYAKYGSSLVAACARNGTDYCDLAGETQWMHRMIDAHQKDAEASGARIVHACGFDSIPSDLGVLFLQNEAQKRFNHPMNRVKFRVKSMRGSASGGTIASILNFVDEVSRDPGVAKIAKNPYALAPPGMRTGIRQPNVNTLEYDADAKSWVGPFVMAAVNTRVVHRSNALLGHIWGKDFKYDEAMIMGPGLMGAIRAVSLAGGLGAFLVGAVLPPTRFLMNKTFLPQPGQGPSRQQRESGFYNIHLIGSDTAGNRLRVIVRGDRDPGYGSTAKMLGESAICLLKDTPRRRIKGGFWTPATAMGQKLIDRLIANAGLTFDVAGEI
jgi:short subunit dehydrogenase-like uncharacterized protein